MDSELSRSDRPEYCEAALPVPLDRLFTYEVPAFARGLVQVGCRVVAPFGRRTVVGVVLDTHCAKPDHETLPLKDLLDERPALGADLLELGRWIARYYCAPIGEVVKSMMPLRGETRRKEVVSLTPAGQAEADGQFLSIGVAAEIMASLRRRPLTCRYLAAKHPGGAEAVRWLRQRGLVRVERVVERRDPTLARDVVLTVELGDPASVPSKPAAGERWLLDYLRHRPGRHDVRALAVERSDAIAVARSLAKAGAVRLAAVRPGAAAVGRAPGFELNRAQREAFGAISAAVREPRFEAFLLHGVTGSGKTEVYLRAIAETLAHGRSALLMVPEIALTPALASAVFGRFGDRAAVLHSALSDAQRADQWHRIQAGEARVVLGTRSAVFAPLRDLGLVIVDEEHDASYKQADTPRYNGRDVALVRARRSSAPAVVGSATPGIESRFNAETGKYTLLRMESRIMERPLPAVQKVDMRREFEETGRGLLFSRALVAAVRACMERGEQCMILLNRRGYSTHLLCRSCGQRAECPNCSVTLTFHKRESSLLCHYCDHSAPVPEMCGSCGREFLQFQGSGSERVEDELARHFPDASIARLDRDTVRGRDSYETILDGFRRGHSRLLVGTQMIAKGHDIPNVTLVCVVDADVGLGRPDFRAAERSFQLLTQVAGRAGRGEKPGQVLIQTMNPDHYAIDLAATQDYEAFYRRETGFRKALWYPPFTSMATIVVRSADLSEAADLSRDLAEHLHSPPDGLRVTGPASAPLVKLRKDYRFQFLIKSLSRAAVASFLARALRFAEERKWPATALVIDVDPVDFA